MDIKEKLLGFHLPKLSVGWRIFFYLLMIFFIMASVLEVVYSKFSMPIDIVIYVCAACAMTIACCYIVTDIKIVWKEMLTPFIEKNAVANRMTKDYRFRTVIVAGGLFFVNFFYALFNGLYGIWYSSPWFGALSAYYIVLSVMRFLVVSYERKTSKSKQSKQSYYAIQKESRIYKTCGILLAFITIALSGAVFLLVNKNIDKSYPGFMIYAIAAYSFYKITMAIINLIKVRKLNAPLLKAIRNIGYADALVSILSLQVAMFTSFGDVGESTTKIFNFLTGSGVCLMILGMAIYMIRKAEKF